MGRTAAMAALLIFGLGSAISVHAQSAVFNFDGDPQGTPTRLNEVNNGVTATFSSPADINGGGFQVEPILFTTLSGNVLHDRGPSGQENIPLNISFSQQLYSISLNFATNDTGSASPLMLTASLNGKQVGVGSATGVFQASTYPEGVLSFASASPFNSVTLTSTPAPDFAVNNIRVSLSPASPALASLAFPSPVSSGSIVTATVTLNGIYPSGIVVGTGSSDPSVVRINRGVIVPAGANSATFVINTFRSHVTKTVTITATLGQVVQTANLTITGR